MIDTEQWRESAACRPVHVAVFFGQGETDLDGTSKSGDDDIAKAVCATCPVIEQCRDEHRHEPLGVWFGTSPEERGFASTGRELTRKSPECIEALRTMMFIYSNEWFTHSEAKASLLDQWTAGSVRASLRALWRSGHLERRGGGRDALGRNNPYEYRWNADHQESQESQ